MKASGQITDKMTSTYDHFVDKEAAMSATPSWGPSGERSVKAYSQGDQTRLKRIEKIT